MTYTLKVGTSVFHFNDDLSGDVEIDGNTSTAVVQFDDLAQFVVRARTIQNRGRVNAPKNLARAAKRAEVLDKVKEQVIELLKAEQVKLLGDETELTKKMFQVAINAVNGAR